MDIEKSPGIYCIENISTGKIYVGQSKNVFYRWMKHKNELNNNSHHNDYLQKAWNKYHEKDFKFYVLEYCSVDRLDEKEKYYIDYYDSTNRNIGYNLKTGGQEGGSKYSEDVKEKMSESLKLFYKNNPEACEEKRRLALLYWSDPITRKSRSGENNSMYGKHHKEDSKRKISEARIGCVSNKRNFTHVLCVEKGQVYQDAITAAKDMSLDSSSILKVCRNERKTCGGFHWLFVN